MIKGDSRDAGVTRRATKERWLLAALVLASPLLAAQAVFAAPTPSAPAQPQKPAEKKQADTKPAPEPVIENIVDVTPEQLVNQPRDFLNKNIKFIGNFYVFTNLALDYKPCMRSSRTHLSFMVLRPNSHIPLSELKLAMPIPKDKDPENQLLAQLKEGDQLEITGKVFGIALDEPYVDVLRLKKLASAPEEKKDEDKKASVEDSQSSPDGAQDSKDSKEHANDKQTPSKRDVVK